MKQYRQKCEKTNTVEAEQFWHKGNGGVTKMCNIKREYIKFACSWCGQPMEMHGLMEPGKQEIIVVCEPYLTEGEVCCQRLANFTYCERPAIRRVHGKEVVPRYYCGAHRSVSEILMTNIVCPGNWIIKHSTGERCKGTNDYFQMVYEEMPQVEALMGV